MATNTEPAGVQSKKGTIHPMYLEMEANNP
jgi:hypothetical protein